MLKKELKLIITFKNTVEAIMMEEKARSAGLPGRIIPIPPAISAGCGLCFMASVNDKKKIFELINKEKISFEAQFEMML